MGTSVDEHHYGEWAAGVVRCDDEAVNLVTVLVREVPRLVRTCRRCGGAEADDLGTRVVEDETLSTTLLVQEPDASVRPYPRLRDVAGLRGDLSECSGLDLVSVEIAATFEGVHEKKSGSVRPPVGDGDRPAEIDSEIRALAGREVPDPRLLISVPLVRERESRVTGDRRPAASSERHPVIEQLTDGDSGARIDDAQRRVNQVAVLGMLEAEQASVRRERSAEEATVVRACERHRFGGAVDLSRRCAVQRHMNREPVAIRDRDDDDSRRLRQPVAPAVRNALEKRLRFAAVERLHQPAARLVAGLVLKPEHAFAVEGRHGVD